MPVFSDNAYNPNPITKLLVTFILGLTVVHKINPYCECFIVVLIFLLFFLNGLKKEAIKAVLVFGILFILPNFLVFSKLNPVIKMFLSLPIIIRMFILPFIAAEFMLKTSDVGSILSSMDKLHISKNISIPIAVMFRYFPAFKEEKKNIKMAMKIRGITFKNPLQYLEYVMVPLLIISSNISDDIAKAAETKAIENPIKKTRYISTRFRIIDLIYILVTTGCVVGGLLWLR